jgi:hypothetical protein
MARAPSDLNPMAEDLTRKGRRRKRRDLPEPAADLKAAKPALRRRAVKRPITPAIMFEQDSEGGYIASPPHNDVDLWELQIADCFSTRSVAVMRAFSRELQGLCSMSWDGHEKAWRPNEEEMSGILAILADAQPKTILQAATAAQAVALHLVTMRLAKQALNSGGMIIAEDAAIMARTAKAFAGHMETLQALQGKRRSTRQNIKVSKETHFHQHSHLHDHRAAGGVQPIEGQSYEPRAEAVGERRALLCDQSGGEVVPLPRGKR